MIVVNFEMGFADKVVARIVIMADGTIVEEGALSKMFGKPHNERTTKFLADVAHEDI